MSRISFRTLLAVSALALVAVVPAIAIAHKGGKSGKRPVGTVVSFTTGGLTDGTGTLVISSGGLPVTAMVTRRTEIEWHGRGHDRGHSSSRDSGDGPNHDRDDDRGDDRHQPTAGGIPTGTLVRKAKLKLSPNGPVWEEIKLIPPAPVPAT